MMDGTPVGPQRCLPTIRITPLNADKRIKDAMETIIHCWNEWEAAATQEVQKHQDDLFWFEEMQDQLVAVLTGMVCDPDIEGEDE